MLRLGLNLADLILSALPARIAYAFADLAGDLWYVVAPARRRLVGANLARVCAATGRPTSGRAFTKLLRSSFRNHARYYVELLRVPHYPLDLIAKHVDVPEWQAFDAALRGRPGVLVTCHLGNFEPFGSFAASRGYRPLAPIEEIEPRELFEFLASRRGAGRIDLVAVRESTRPLIRRLRDNGLVGIIGDRDLAGDGRTVVMFGHPTTMPIGPAWLAVSHRATLIVGRCLRIGPDRFRAEGEQLEIPASGDRRADTAILVELIAARFERDIGEAPDQWWGAFQPFWPDLK
jgi:phosphatidylinositol dimannoside acyltransferase